MEWNRFRDKATCCCRWCEPMSVLRLLPQYAWKLVCMYVYGMAHSYIIYVYKTHLFWYSIFEIHQQPKQQQQKNPIAFDHKIWSHFFLSFCTHKQNKLLCLRLNWFINKIIHTFIVCLLVFDEIHFSTPEIFEFWADSIKLSFEVFYCRITTTIETQRYKLRTVQCNNLPIWKAGPREGEREIVAADATV